MTGFEAAVEAAARVLCSVVTINSGLRYCNVHHRHIEGQNRWHCPIGEADAVTALTAALPLLQADAEDRAEKFGRVHVDHAVAILDDERDQIARMLEVDADEHSHPTDYALRRAASAVRARRAARRGGEDQ